MNGKQNEKINKRGISTVFPFVSASIQTRFDFIVFLFLYFFCDCSEYCYSVVQNDRPRLFSDNSVDFAVKKLFFLLSYNNNDNTGNRVSCLSLTWENARGRLNCAFVQYTPLEWPFYFIRIEKILLKYPFTCTPCNVPLPIR